MAEPRTVADLVLRAPASHEAIVDGEHRVTYGELGELIERAASALLAAGLVPGDRVALRLATSLDFVALYLGAARAGVVVVPVNPAYTSPELAHVLVDSGARLLVTASAEPVEVPVRTPADVLGEVADGSVALASASADRPGLAALLYTSGTSGLPKGAMLSSAALLANLEQIAALDPAPITSADTVLIVVPLFHILGLNAGLGTALHVGARIVLADRFDAGATLDLMASSGVTAVAGVPGMFAQWAAHPSFARGFAAVRFAWSGAAPLPPALVARYAAIGVGLYEGYGLTEASPVICTNFSAAAPKAGSVGRPLPGLQVELRDQDGSLVEDDDPGEVFVRGLNLFDGYWPDASGGPDADGWWPTGDLAVADEDGDLYLVGRTGDLVIVNGFNVYPAEVERVLRSIDGVADVAVLGVPDDEQGEAVSAYVVAEPGVGLDPDALLAQAAGSLARFKLPRQIEFVAALPHTATGKVMKWRIRDAGS